MPSALIEVRRSHTQAEEVALLEAVHESLVAAFRIPPTDKHVRLVSHEPHRFACSPNLAAPELATLVSIDCFAGRSLDAKRALYREIVERFADLGIPNDHVTIMIREITTENWGIRGGQAASDVDLGFKIDV
jgi:phenylpyruvate tautomerase PptA (4-oxalocrotonate tautomerase family)